MAATHERSDKPGEQRRIPAGGVPVWTECPGPRQSACEGWVISDVAADLTVGAESWANSGSTVPSPVTPDHRRAKRF